MATPFVVQGRAPKEFFPPIYPTAVATLPPAKNTARAVIEAIRPVILGKFGILYGGS
jgi:hypothetical protein